MIAPRSATPAMIPNVAKSTMPNVDVPNDSQGRSPVVITTLSTVVVALPSPARRKRDHDALHRRGGASVSGEEDASGPILLEVIRVGHDEHDARARDDVRIVGDKRGAAGVHDADGG